MMGRAEPSERVEKSGRSLMNSLLRLSALWASDVSDDFEPVKY